MLAPSDGELKFIRSCAPADLNGFLEKCSIYGDFLYETNATMNLTRIPPEEFWTKHVCDSLALALRYPMPAEGHHLKVCDVGCGAGLPSLILASAFPALFVTAIDSTGKKIRFVQQASEKMGLTNLRALQARANELAHKQDFRHAFKLVTARAVGSAEVLMREASGLICKGGTLILYRTRSQAEPEADWLHSLKNPPPFELSETLVLPDGEERMFMKINGLS